MITIEDIAILKYRNEDFQVREVSLLPTHLSMTSENNHHTVLVIQKNGFTTFEVMHFLAKFFHLDRQQIHCQGLKDEDGVTEQLMSVQCIIESEAIARFNAKHAQLSKGWVKAGIRGYTEEPLQEKSLHGNVFAITVRNLDASQADRLINYCFAFQDFVCANYYDQQRFGLPEGPYIAHEIGKAIVENDWPKADALYRKSGNLELDFPDQTHLPDTVIDKIDLRKLNFFGAAYASSQWNDALSKHIHSDSFITIFDHYRVKALTENTDLLPPILSSIGYTVSEDLSVVARVKSRSSLISTTVYPTPKKPDVFFPGKWTIDLQFLLPTGSYATMLWKQFWTAEAAHRAHAFKVPQATVH